MWLRAIWLPLLLLLCSAGSFQLSKKDIRATMEAMFNFHVEYKQFNTVLAHRSIKLYMEQFDAEKRYLLSREVLPYLDLNEKKLQGIVEGYYKDNFSTYESLEGLFHEAVSRARRLREECYKEILADSEEAQRAWPSFVDYAKNEAELKERIKSYIVWLLAKEKKQAEARQWGIEQKQKAFALWERRFRRMEQSYTLVGDNGQKLPKELLVHYTALHILKASAKCLDAHTSFYSPEEAAEMRAMLEKQFEGIGVVLREGIEGVVIVDLVKGGPAEKSGHIFAGDVIIEIDGETIVNASYDEVLRRLQGKGSGVIQLGLKRFVSTTQDLYLKVGLVREKILMQDERLQFSYEPFADGIIGKLNLPSFYESTGSSSCELDIREALRMLKQKGKLYGLVLDLRENSGGFLSQAVKVASLFLSSGVVVISKYAQGEMHYLRNLDIKSYYTGPLIVLTSRASASAAEIVAQALQDYGTAIVVGDERTYGKGTIQYQTVTDPEAVSFFKVTVGRYYTVSGRSTQIEGVLADLLLPTLYSAINIGERYLEFPLKNDRVPAAYVDPLSDIDQRNYPWFQKNYLPHLQKKLSVWTQTLPQLKENHEGRLASNQDYNNFLKAVEEVKAGKPVNLKGNENWGSEDLQMTEAIKILKDMIVIKDSIVHQ